MQAAVGRRCVFVWLPGVQTWIFVPANRVLSDFPLFVSDSEMRVQSAEQRSLKAEEALQSALVKIQDLERHLQGRSSVIAEGTELQTWN